MKAKFLETEKYIYLFTEDNVGNEKLSRINGKKVIPLPPNEFKQMKFLLIGDTIRSGIVIHNGEEYLLV